MEKTDRMQIWKREREKENDAARNIMKRVLLGFLNFPIPPFWKSFFIGALYSGASGTIYTGAMIITFWNAARCKCEQ